LQNILTKREKEILTLIIQEKTSAEMAELFNLSIRTIETHRKNILRKTNSKTFIGIIKFAIKIGLIEDFHFKKNVQKKLKVSDIPNNTDMKNTEGYGL
jgi:DNA-binding CsgD family transcriptional regulator